MTKKLKTLEEHNAQAMSGCRDMGVPKLNGIACPKCGEEMFDSQPNTVLTSYPAQKHVACMCGYAGYRIA